MAPRRPGRPGQAVRRDAARGEGDHRAGPDPGRDNRDHPGERAAGRCGPGERRGHRRRAHAQRETAEYIAGKKEDGNRESDYFLFVKGNQPSLQKALFDAIQEEGPREPDHTELDYGHGRIIRRSLWVTDAGDIDFPHASRVARIRRDRYDLDGTLISKEIVHAVTSLAEDRASAADLARIARGQWGIESVHWLRDTAYAEDANTAYAGSGPQVMATLRNLAVSLLYLAGVKEVTRTLQAIGRDRNRILNYLPL
jgi:hypothetical protein